MRVDMEPVKPARCQCEHAVKHGCAIYDDRPEPCRDWSCLWLLTQGDPAVRLPSALRPDRSGVVLEPNTAGNLVAHSRRPNDWRAEPMGTWLRNMARRTRVLIENGEDVLLLNADGSLDALDFVGVDPSSNERKYVRTRAAG